MPSMENKQKNSNKLAALEALLFLCADPVGITKVRRLLKTGGKETDELTKKLAESLEKEERGLILVRNGNQVQLATKSGLVFEPGDILKEELKEELSPAALETLSIIAYLGPIPKLKIDYLRGVNSSFALRNLLVRGLAEKESDAENSGSSVYRVSLDFLKHLGLGQIEDLPEYQKHKTILSNLNLYAP